MLRINQLHIDLIETKRVKCDDGKWFKRQSINNKWIEMKIYKGGQVGITHTNGTGISLSHLKFLMDYPGPYTLSQLVSFMYEGIFHKYYGWIEGFWDEITLTMYFDKLKQQSEPLYESYIRDHHLAFYKATQRLYKGRYSYRSFLISVGENPDLISRNTEIGVFLKQGKEIEFDIVKILSKVDAPFEYFKRFSNGCTPDLYNSKVHIAIDIKRSIKTEIDKEVLKYKNEFDAVTVIYLLGSRETITVKHGIRKMSIYKWLGLQPFFKKLEVEKQTEIISELDLIVKSIDENQYNSDIHEYHKMLVEQIIAYDKQGMDNPTIAQKVNISYKYVNVILLGKALAEYSGTYPLEYKLRQKQKKQNYQETIMNLIELSHEGKPSIEIANQLNMSINMVNYHLRNLGLNQSANMKIRNNKIHELLSSYTDHEILSEKFEWIVDSLIHEHPDITFSIVKGYYYSKFDGKENKTKFMKGKEDYRVKITQLYQDGMRSQDIAEVLELPLERVRDRLRKMNLGKKDMLLIRNQKINVYLKKYEMTSTLKERFQRVVEQLKQEYPTLTTEHVRTYYYNHFKKSDLEK